MDQAEFWELMVKQWAKQKTLLPSQSSHSDGQKNNQNLNASKTDLFQHDECYAEEQSGGKGMGTVGKKFAVLNSVIRLSFIEKVIFEKRPQKEAKWMSEQREWKVGSPFNGNVGGISGEQR